MTKNNSSLASTVAITKIATDTSQSVALMGVDIKYIQKDIAEIKETVKVLTAGFVTKEEFNPMSSKVDYLTKVVYLGLGGLSVITFFLKFFVK